MSKNTIGSLYILSLIVNILAITLIGLTWMDQQRCCSSTPPFSDHDSQTFLVVTVIIMIGASGMAMTAWIGALMNLGKAREWTWFLLLFFFGGIVLLIYLIVGPQPLKAGHSQQTQQRSADQQPGYSPGVPLQPPTSQAYQSPQPVSALEILQQRYARGEIDATTFEQMRDRLKA